MDTHDHNSETPPIYEAPPARSAPQAEAAPPIPNLDRPASPDQVVVQLRQEHLVPVKGWVQTGAVTVHKGVESYPQTIPVEVLREEVDIQRIPIHLPLPQGAVAAPWQDGDTLVIPIVHEELVVTKHLVVREEMRITKRRVTGTEQVSDTVRRETINVDTEGKVQVHQPPATGPDLDQTQQLYRPPGA